MVETKTKKSAPNKTPKDKVATEKAKMPTAQQSATGNEDKKKLVTQQKSETASKTESPSKLKKEMLTIKQVGSPIRRDPRQSLYLKSLGLGKLNRVRQVVDNASTRGLLEKLRHMVVVMEQ